MRRESTRQEVVRSVPLIVIAAALAGCGPAGPPPGVTVTGKVVQAGQPLTAERLPPGEFAAEVIFVPLGTAGGEREKLSADGSFKEAGAGKGMPPGKYKVAVIHYVQGRGSDGLKGAFSEQSTPITVDIPASQSGGTHDLGTLELNDYSKK